jgi:hypothetical protein
MKNRLLLLRKNIVREYCFAVKMSQRLHNLGRVSSASLRSGKRIISQPPED